MKNLFLTAVAALMLCTPTVAFAEETDMAKLTCKDFMDAAPNQQQMSILLAWIDGYMSAASDNTVMSDEWMTKLGTHMVTYCQANSGKTIMEAMDAMPE